MCIQFQHPDSLAGAHLEGLLEKVADGTQYLSSGKGRACDP